MQQAIICDNIKRGVAITSLLLCSIVLFAQPKADYYTSNYASGETLDGKYGRALELTLAEIVYPHTERTYNQLWTDFQTTDVVPLDMLVDPSRTDQVYDMYASILDFPKYYSDNNHEQTGGFNREHGVPNSWWGGTSANCPAYTDLHHLMPSDGCANGAKANYPLGEYSEGMTLVWPKDTKTNTNGYTYVVADNTPDHTGSWSHVWSFNSKGADAYGGGVGHVFEPKDEFKGDFARMYLYVVCAYEGNINWETTYMFTSDAQRYTTIKPWAKELLLKWHRQDRVSDKERARNNAVESLQGNRNPFIDYPELVEYIWGDKGTQPFSWASAVSAYSDEYINEKETEPDVVVPQETVVGFPHVAYVGEPFVAPKLTTNSTGTIRFTSSNADVAEVDATTGEVTVKSQGTAVITAFQEATAQYEAASTRYVIQVRRR